MKRGLSNTRCPRCNGNIFFEKDDDVTAGNRQGWYGWCLQCGHTVYVKPEPAVTEEYRT